MSSGNTPCIDGEPPSWCDHSRTGGKCDVCHSNGGCHWEDACVGRGCRDLRDGKVAEDGTPLCLAGG